MSSRSSEDADGGRPRAGRGRDGGINRRSLLRQRYVLIAICAGAIGVAAFAVFATETPSSSPAAEAVQLLMPGEAVEAGQLWKASAEKDLESLAEKNRDLERSLTQMSSSLEDIEKRLGATLDDIQQAQADAIESDIERELYLLSRQVADATTPAPAPAVSTSDLPEPPPQLEPDHAPALPPLRFVRTSTVSEAGLAATDAIVDNAALAAQAAVSYATDEPEQAPLDHAHYLPGGTFMSAVILGGIDAPTSTAARDNPHPVLLRIADLARLPNLARKDLRECLVLAAGYGDISSERALLRTERLSCRRRDGTFFDAPVRGFIVGEDGRAGIRGRLVTKQGQLLAESFAAGVGAGFGDLLKGSYQAQLQQSRQQVIASTAATTSLDSNRLGFADYARAGVGAGFGSALGRLSEYYIALAERIHPVIEIGAGRKVDIVLQEGVDLLAEPKLGS